MTEKERYEIEEDLFYNIECVWDKEKAIGKTEDKETIIKLVTILNKQDKEINQLTKARNKHFQSLIDSEEINEALIKENEELKKEKYQTPFLKIFDDYFIYYRDATFSMHKPKDIRGLCFLLNKEHGFTELQCEYNDEERI